MIFRLYLISSSVIRMDGEMIERLGSALKIFLWKIDWLSKYHRDYKDLLDSDKILIKNIECATEFLECSLSAQSTLNFTKWKNWLRIRISSEMLNYR